MAGIDVNRTTAGVYLPPEVSAEIWSATEYASAAMQLATEVPLPGSGVSVDIITGEPEAEWVAETDEKPVSRPTFDNKLMAPYMLAVIVPFSNQFRRDKSRLYAEIVRKLPQALAKKFDSTVFGGDTGPGDNFDTLTDLDAIGIAGEDTYQGLVAADAAVASAGGTLNGWGVAPQGKSLLLGATDGIGRPLFLQDATSTNSVATVLGAPVYVSKGVYVAGSPNQVGVAGDWAQASWGSVEGVQVSIADQASLNDGDTQLNLWQRNMFAVRAEIEVGFRVRSTDYFVSLTDDEYTPGS